MNVVIICPTYNASSLWVKWIEAVNNQAGVAFKVMIIDSSSKDDTVEKSKKAGFEVLVIPQEEFNHAGTRNMAAYHARDLYDPDLIIFLTQDAILSSKDSIKTIVKSFEEDSLAAVCGRQLPHDDADPIAAHSRYYNYPSASRVNTTSDIKTIGLKAAYMSNSFAAYRYSVFEQCGGFPDGLIFGEDMFLAAQMLLKGYKTAYSGQAVVRHSHNYSLTEEFKRYFDIGVFHSSQPFLLQNFGGPSGEGVKFAISEVRYCLKKGSLYWVLNSVLRTGLKFIGYKLGKAHKALPGNINRAFSMDKNYWE